MLGKAKLVCARLFVGRQQHLHFVRKRSNGGKRRAPDVDGMSRKRPLCAQNSRSQFRYAHQEFLASHAPVQRVTRWRLLTRVSVGRSDPSRGHSLPEGTIVVGPSCPIAPTFPVASRDSCTPSHPRIVSWCYSALCYDRGRSSDPLIHPPAVLPLRNCANMAIAI